MGVDTETANTYRTQVIRGSIEQKYQSTISFNPLTGNLSSIMCSKTLSVGHLYQQIRSIETTQESKQKWRSWTVESFNQISAPARFVSPVYFVGVILRDFVEYIFQVQI